MFLLGRKGFLIRILYPLILVATWCIYSVGFGGPFLLDDFPHLAKLSENGGINGFDSAVAFIFGGNSGPLGRPLSLASILWDATNWPADASVLKKTNTALHLFNGSLLYLLFMNLLRFWGKSRTSSRIISMLASAVWLMHPLFVSTTLYAIQRMTLLSTTFCLCGLLFYCAGRNRLNARNPAGGFYLMSAAVILFTLISTLAKEIGLLLPLMIFILERFAFAKFNYRLSHQTCARLRLWVRVFLLFPTLILVALILNEVVTSLHSYTEIRGVSPYLRVLTEARIVVDYIGLLVVPRSLTAGLFYDHIQVSAGLLNPISTLFSLCGLFILCSVAWFVRDRSPALTILVFFFLSGHLLESTILPLELAFEHRNYLPSIFIGLPMVMWIWERFSTQNLKRGVIYFLMLLILALSTYSRASLWGDTERLAATWAQYNPGSPRALAYYAYHLMESERTQEAIVVLEYATMQFSNDAMLESALFTAICQKNESDDDHIRRYQKTLQFEQVDFLLLYKTLERIVRYRQNVCPGLTVNDVLLLLSAVHRNQWIERKPIWKSEFHVLSAENYLQNNRLVESAAEFTRAQSLNNSAQLILYGAAYFGSMGYPLAGVRFIDQFYRNTENQSSRAISANRLARWLGIKNATINSELEVLRAKLINDLL